MRGAMKKIFSGILASIMLAVLVVPASAALINVPVASTWNLASGLEVDGNTIRLINNYPFFNLEQADGLLFIEQDSGESFGNGAGILRTNKDFIELVNWSDPLRTGVYKNGFSATGDFEVRFKFRGNAGTANVFFGMSTLSYASANRDILVGPFNFEGIFGVLRVNGISSLNSVKGGVRTGSAGNAFSANTTLYIKVERSGTDGIITIYSDKFSSVLTTETINNVAATTLTSAWLGVSRNLASGGGSGAFGWIDEIELRFNGDTKYSSSSDVAEMASALTVGENIDQIDFAETTEAGANIKYQWDTGGGYNGIWNTLTFMQTALVNTSPATLRLKSQFNSDGDGRGTLDLNGTESVLGASDGGGGVADDRLIGPAMGF